MPPPMEPTLAALPNPFLRYFAATRPAFLSVTFVGCLVGLGSGAASGIAIDPTLATVTLFFALVAHAGANVINAYSPSPVAAVSSRTASSANTRSAATATRCWRR